MKPRSKVCFIGQLILQQEKHFHLTSYDLDLDFFRESMGILVDIIMTSTENIKNNNSCSNF